MDTEIRTLHYHDGTAVRDLTPALRELAASPRYVVFKTTGGYIVVDRLDASGGTPLSCPMRKAIAQQHADSMEKTHRWFLSIGDPDVPTMRAVLRAEGIES